MEESEIGIQILVGPLARIIGLFCPPRAGVHCYVDLAKVYYYINLQARLISKYQLLALQHCSTTDKVMILMCIYNLLETFRLRKLYAEAFYPRLLVTSCSRISSTCILKGCRFFCPPRSQHCSLPQTWAVFRWSTRLTASTNSPDFLHC